MDLELRHRNIIVLLVILGCVLPILANIDHPLYNNPSITKIDHSSYRLPTEIIPNSYDLRLETKLGVNDFSYQGRVKITVNVLKKTDTIIVNNDGLNVHEEKTSFSRKNSNDSTLIVKQHLDEERQFYIINFKDTLQPGEYVLTLFFDGEVRDDVFGFYRSSYDVDGETKWMGVTQFSPTHARRAFPCMDEPHLKAVFTIQIVHNDNQIATSNSPVESVARDSNNRNYIVTCFKPTPRMSTFIVGWAVHDFVPQTSSTSDRFKMWTRNVMHRRGTLSLNLGRQVYLTLERYLSVENPIKKMDQFALPDFNFNAMENWGMITYRESVVLYEDHVTQASKIINGLTTMSHEYAHTWFGNLATPRFWDVVWLKEGFATYFQYFGLSIVKPDWGMMDKFVVDTLHTALLADSVHHARTMNGRDVGSPSSIMSTLDFVSYKKGASIIRMIRHVMGESEFQTGIREYLKNMAYRAASPSDLYPHLQSVMNKSPHTHTDVRIEDVMESWTNQPGYPVVTITRDYSTETLNVSQERFYRNRSDATIELNKSRWWIPLNFAARSKIDDFSNTTTRYWLKPCDKNVIIGSVPSSDWVIFNVQQVGYYRVNYDENNWRMISDYLKSKEFRKIHRANRAALLDDAFNLARAGYLDYCIPFHLSSYLVQESEYEPWLAAVNSLKFLDKMLSPLPELHTVFQRYAVQLLEPMYKQLSFSESPGEDLTTKLHRELILSASCSVNNAHCVKTSTALFGSWISTADKRISPDIKSSVYCVGVRKGDENVWHAMWERFLHTDLHTEQELLLSGLGCTENPELINKFLNSSLSDEYGIRKQYRISVINAVLAGNPANVEHCLEFVRNNLRRIVDTRGHAFLGKIFTAIGEKIIREGLAERLRVFVNDNVDRMGSAINAAKEAIDTSFANVEWLKIYSSRIATCLS